MGEETIAIQATAPSGILELLTGNKVLELLSDINFQDEWNELYDSCPWATVFQSKIFVLTWYTIYSKEYLPILVKSYSGEKLTGLLLLAKNKRGMVVGAGANRAEYQTWLAEASEGVRFIKQALCELRKTFPTCDISLKFIPPNVPLEWARKDAPWVRICVLRAFNQPLWFLEKEKITKRLKKQKSKINQLKKLGELTLDIVSNIDQFRSIIDFITIQSDFRKGAIYNTTPFQEDPQRKELLLKLFELDFLHVSIIKLNEEIIASKVATKAGNCIISQGMSSYAPSYAPYSPGILHFLMLGKHLIEEGYTLFDLSPGEDAYKLDLATHNQQAFELRIAGTRKSYISAITAKSLFTVFIKNKQKIYHFLSLIGISPKSLRQSTRKMKIAHESIRLNRMRIFTLSIRELLRFGSMSQQVEIYKIAEPNPTEMCLPIKKNSLQDLIRYDAGSKLLRGEFLTRAMEKFELGHQTYTLTEGSRLLYCVWLKEQTIKSKDSDTKTNKLFREGSMILYDVYSHPKGKSNLKNFLTSVASSIAAGNNKKGIYLVAGSSDKFLCSAFEKVISIKSRNSSQVYRQLIV